MSIIFRKCKTCSVDFADSSRCVYGSGLCSDCLRLAAGYTAIGDYVSTFTWWKPWTWRRKDEFRLYWNAKDAIARVAKNTAAAEGRS